MGDQKSRCRSRPAIWPKIQPEMKRLAMAGRGSSLPQMRKPTSPPPQKVMWLKIPGAKKLAIPPRTRPGSQQIIVRAGATLVRSLRTTANQKMRRAISAIDIFELL